MRTSKKESFQNKGLVNPMIQHIRIYTTEWCGDCHRAKAFLRSRNIAFEEINIEEIPGADDIVTRANDGKRAVPTLEIDGRFVPCSPFRPNILVNALGLE